MKKALVGFLFILSLHCYGQVSIKTNLHCGTGNKKALEYFESGNFGIQTNRLETAAKLFLGAISLDSTFCDAWDNLAVCYKKMGRYEDAFNASLYSLMIDSTNVVAWSNCGSAAFLQNDIYKALMSYDHLKRIIPNSPEGYYGKSLVLYSIDSIAEARDNIVVAEQIYKNNKIKIGKEVYLLKGFIEFKAGNKHEAQDLFEKVYSSFKNNSELNYFLGICLLENNNDVKKSQKYIDRAIQLGYIPEE